MTPSIKIGVSACLLGEHVRYDGGHKHDRNITACLEACFSLVPICPEVGCGLPVPREAMRLEGDPAAPRLMTSQTRADKTEEMLLFCSEKMIELEAIGLRGFIFKERSPSCGLSAVPLCTDCASELYTIGLFANEVLRHFPSMPLEEAERLNDPGALGNFIEKVMSYHPEMNLKINSASPLTPKTEQIP